MQTRLIVPPVVEPLTIAEARMHMRDPEVTTDADILWMIQVARETAEDKLGRALLTQTWEATLDYFPSSCYWRGYVDGRYLDNYTTIELPYPPLQSITSVTYADADGATQTLATTEYTVSIGSLNGSVGLAYGKSWPTTRSARNAVTIRYVAGWTHPDNIPARIKHWMKLFITTMDQYRTPIIEGHIVEELPFADHLLDRHKIISV